MTGHNQSSAVIQSLSFSMTVTMTMSTPTSAIISTTVSVRVIASADTVMMSMMGMRVLQMGWECKRVSPTAAALCRPRWPCTTTDTTLSISADYYPRFRERLGGTWAGSRATTGS